MLARRASTARHQVAARDRRVGERVEQRGLADARGAAHHEQRGAPALEAVAGGQERGQLLATTDERLLDVRGDAAPTQRRWGAITERSDHRARRRTRRRIPREERGDQLIERRGQVRGPGRRAGRIALGLVRQHLHRRALERRSTGEQLERGDAQRVQIERRRRRAPARELGRDVLDRAGELGGRVGDRHRQPEIEQHDAAGAVDQRVGWLDVTMDHAGAVERRQRRRELTHRCARALDAIAGRDPGRQIDPRDVLHREAQRTIVLEQLAQAHQPGVAHRRRQAELALDAIEHRRGTIVKHLHRDGLAELAVARLVHHAGRSGAELLHQLEARGEHGLLGQDTTTVHEPASVWPESGEVNRPDSYIAAPSHRDPVVEQARPGGFIPRMGLRIILLR